MPELLQAQLLGNMESRADADVKQRRSAGNSGSAASREGAPLPLSQRGVRLAAQEKVRQLGGTSQIPITLRLAEGLNDEVDEIAHRHRKAKVKKQDLITLAVQLLITELDSGADLSDLLDTYARSGR